MYRVWRAVTAQLLQQMAMGSSPSPGRVKHLHFSISSRPILSPIQPPIQCVPWVFSPGVKRPESEANH
jgi:hypothetical protein